MTYDDAVEAWFDERLAIGEIAAFTAKKSRQKALILSSFIGDTELDEIQQKDIVSAIGKLRQSGNSHYHGEKGFSQSIYKSMRFYYRGDMQIPLNEIRSFTRK